MKITQLAFIKLYLSTEFEMLYKHNFFNPYIVFLMQPVIKTVLVGNDNICISVLVDYLSIVQLSIPVGVLFVMPNECPPGSRVLPLFKFT